ncbi:transcription antitermination factor NusB [Dechloromonas denitrificans]|uniref:transcription antitermination factor NusB n=1 Tax=Azonexaceae TaxID=2008795 RepID=UPI001CF7F64E|nr:transcription antitermination factor NusB [Dechloromonas denitrificans]UCV04202.1 transcription antitermination factor NusB [Dechloromonas denitrificans]UCV08490.1 transcription antitermination factor NusB [Dechloromonas denitrificans]
MTTFLSDSEHPEEPKAPHKSARRRSREFILQGLYQWRVGGADEAAIEAYAPEMEGFAKADREFFVGTLRGVIGQKDKLTEQISIHIDRPFSELSPVEACILMLGAFELGNHPETPYRVIINEAIELTKSFGGTDGHKYVNGVLDKVAAIIRPDEVAAKKAR